MKVKFKIRKANDPLHDKDWVEEVLGEVVTFPEFPTLKFFSRESRMLNDYWEITESKTGMLVSECFGRLETIDKLQRCIHERGVEAIEKTIAEQVKNFGGELNK